MLFIFLRFYIFLRKRGSEGEREGEKYQNVVASCTPSAGDPACNPGMCPPWGWNLHPSLHSLVLTLLLHTNQGITYISKKCTNRKCPRIRLPMRGKTPLKGGKVWEAALILSFFLVAARCHLIFTLISL